MESKTDDLANKRQKLKNMIKLTNITKKMNEIFDQITELQEELTTLMDQKEKLLVDMKLVKPSELNDSSNQTIEVGQVEQEIVDDQESLRDHIEKRRQLLHNSK